MVNKLNNAGVETTHPEYDKVIDKWQAVDDVVASDIDTYLRNVAMCETDDDQKAKRQKEYVEGAILDNFTQKTLSGLTGAAFMKPPTIDLQSNLDYLLEDVDGVGCTLEQQAKQVVEQDLRKGRVGLLVDMPQLEKGQSITLASMENGSTVPRIYLYHAENIINWNYRRFGSAQKLSLVVLREEKKRYANDIFSHDMECQYRVLGLDEEGFYYQQVFDSNAVAGEQIYPMQNGKRMSDIPFFFIGVQDNTASVDASPLFPIAELNIGHYRNSADTEENSFICSQAMLILALSDQINADQWAKENPKGVQIGSRRGLNVGHGGSAEFIQAAESDKAMRLMEMKKQQAVELGAQIITPSQQVTAESARIQQSVNHSVLSAITQNTTMAYRDALTECAKFLGTEYTSDFKVNQDFYFAMLTSQDRAQWVMEIQQGVTPRTLYYRKLRETGDFPDDWTDEDIDRALQNDMNNLLGFTASPPTEEDAE